MNLRFEVAQNDTLKRQKGKDFQLFKPFELPINKSSIAGYVALTGAAVNILDVYALPQDLPFQFDTSFDQRNNYRTQSLLAVPLKDPPGDVVGVLQLINAEDDAGRVMPFSAHHEALVQALASQAAVAINNARLLETLEQLRAAEQKRHDHYLEAIFRSVKDAIITLDLDLNILAVNDAARSLCGLDPRQVVGRNFKEVVRDCQGGCLEAVQDFLANGSVSREYRRDCQRVLRPEQLVSLTAAPLKDHEDRSIGALLVLRDLTPEAAGAADLSQRYRRFQIIGASPAMQRVYRVMDDLLPTDTTVLITGETGVGKELVANALHYGGPRAHKPLVKVDCTALAENLLESELFGHVKGAFTGAYKDRVGRLQTAQGGSVFLDEIGDISLRTQVKLLRFMEEKRFERVGDSATIQADVRLMAATHRDLRQMVKQGRFRQDLFFRLKVFEVSLPPLRERLEDLPLLVEHFRQLFNQTYKKQVEGILPEVMALFRGYAWPGNVRELKHVMEHAFVQCRGAVIQPGDLPADLRQVAAETAATGGRKKDFSRQEVLQALNRTDWNKAKAARALGISRPTLYRLLAEYDLDQHTTENNLTTKL
jgi:PAS domain S-box-containing protein